ncbi:MAG: tryptophan--tRNA ligase [Candidatus Saelkia tenebricola]|nr:tryptophan--tRNA ligase [Candidatus Saelkia tenebricola]
MRKRILSGMRPTGSLHLGHLVGALKNWVDLQHEYQCFFMIADWHALMSEYKDSKKISEYSFDNLLDWLAAGLNPDQSILFKQSDVVEHAELNLILSIITPLGWLSRCPTYKEQINELHEKEISTHGFLGYPVLQAADIILYKADCVPVGEDQLPHLELCREIIRRFHYLFKKEIFPEPEALLTIIPKLAGLDGRKMSKSYDNFIALSDTPDVIREKIKSMFTDPQRIKRTDPGRPEVCNVYKYYQVFAPKMKDDVYKECKGADIGCVQDKERFAEFLIELLKPHQQRRRDLEKNKDYLEEVLRKGAEKAREVAFETFSEVKKAIGI